MRFYNTLTKQQDILQPRHDTGVTIYSCGPTVYDHIHIGNLSAFIYADLLRRVIQASGLKTKHVMNFTDVDDKTIRRSHEQYPDLPPKAALTKLTRQYEEIFLQDMVVIGNDISAVQFVRATDPKSIAGMQQLITELYRDNFAYIADDGVYFSIEAYKRSGKKYGQLVTVTNDNTSQARISNDEYDKDSAHDFALWKTKKPTEPSWEFVLDDHDLAGRPGWHIECSVMSSQSLGQPFDIHTGGIDLAFPHHENEIAQSTAGKDNAVYCSMFIHNEHLLVDGRKMSKSLQNFFTLEDIIAKGFEPLAFRLLVLQSHYRTQSNFTWESLEAAQNRLNELRAWADLRHQPSTDSIPKDLDDLFDTTRQQIITALQDDLNTPLALAHLNKLVSYMLTVPIPGVEGNYTDGTLAFLDSLFGLNLANRPDITRDQKELIHKREKARQAKDFKASDQIRNDLLKQGIELRDTSFGPQWARTSVTKRS